MSKEFGKFLAKVEGDMMDKYAESTLRYAEAAQQVLQEYKQNDGEGPKGLDWTMGRSTNPVFSADNPLRFIQADQEGYAEAHIIDGTYVGFSGEAYQRLQELTGSDKQISDDSNE